VEGGGENHVGEKRREARQRVTVLICAGEGNYGLGSLLARAIGCRASRQVRGQAALEASRAFGKWLEQAKQAEVVPYPEHADGGGVSPCLVQYVGEGALRGEGTYSARTTSGPASMLGAPEWEK
jgi:hypothetical protein